MHDVIEAVYISGVFKPLGEVKLPNGQRVDLEIKEKKAQPNISLRGIWKELEISDMDIKKAKQSWEKGVEKQIEILEDE
ncbi:MAG: DUF104 domain-containing protein [Methanosarcinales archaeon]|nr:MAG: DUF104 domain-containing protein [Methanosarcinales archaeon]